jgi:NAD(P)-dependent dehydrogenase (short-subunit alcohol dehydrogenase family)
MSAKLAIVTGATSGIGLETARGLVTAGWDVVLACRDVVRAEAVRDMLRAGDPSAQVSIARLDLASFASIRACAASLLQQHPAIHLLVDNAGVFSDRPTRTAEGFEATMGVNFLGTLLFTRLLIPALRTAAAQEGEARVVVVSSAAAAFARLRPHAGMFADGPSGFPGYAASKLALVHGAAALAAELEGTGVTVNAVHPGDAATNIWRGHSLVMCIVGPVMRRVLKAPADAARAVLHVAVAPELVGVTGAFFGVRGERLRAARYEDLTLRAGLMEQANAAWRPS